MKLLLATVFLFEAALAFPRLDGTLTDNHVAALNKRKAPRACGTIKKCDDTGTYAMSISDKAIGYDPKAPTAAQKASAARTDCGEQQCIPNVFNAKAQYVSTSGENAYADPTPGQIRGPCPGLNAAANHGYLDRSGVTDIANTVLGLGQAYGMNADLAGFLAAYAIAIDGDVLGMTWSIGGPQQTDIPLGLVHRPEGISYSHNKYEGDSSISRCDAYLNKGDAHSLDIQRFTAAWYACTDNRCTLDKWSRDFTRKALTSIATNPLYTAPLFSTTLVSPAAYNFVVNMMANRTAEQKTGYLNRQMFQTFFAVSGSSPEKFKWNPGKERIPENWYRRPMLGAGTEYTAFEGVFGDLAAEFAAYPESFKFGGNTGKKNSFVGIDLGEFTNGQFSSTTTPGNRDELACFFYRFAQQFFPDFIQAGPNGGSAASKAAEKLLFSFLDKAFSTLAHCPKGSLFNDNVFAKYPGYKYYPKGHPGQAC